MKSVRLDADLHRRVKETARLLGVSESQVIKDAVAAHCEMVLGQRLDARLRDVIDSLHSGGGRSEKTGKQFQEILLAKKSLQ